MINWALARKNNWELVLRMEDLVGPRIDIDSIELTITILKWLGIDWDGVMKLQSKNLAPYAEGLQVLIKNNDAYHCNLTRKEIDEAASAPHLDDTVVQNNIRPENICEHNQRWDQSATNWRFFVRSTSCTIKDELYPEIIFDDLKDFVIWTKNNLPAYQLAVVTDDARQGVTDVVRGHDLLESAAWQTQIYEALGLDTPRWWHLPLVVGEDGRRLAKRHGDTRLQTYLQSGMRAEKIIGLLGNWCKVTEKHNELTTKEFLDGFDIRNVSTEDIVYTKEDERWLLDS
jgi:glutamyl-tRNA synthetase